MSGNSVAEIRCLKKSTIPVSSNGTGFELAARSNMVGKTVIVAGVRPAKEKVTVTFA